MASNLMTKSIVIAAVVLLLITSCGSDEEKDTPVNNIEDTTIVLSDSAIIIEDTLQPTESEINSNSAFRNVKVKRSSADTVTVSGEARVFEAVFGWVVEDGHNELAHGFTTASMGAPEWGTFNINIPAKKTDPNTTLMLLIFENSAADDSRIHELAIPIPPDM